MLKQTRDLVLTSDIEGPVALGDFWEIFPPIRQVGKNVFLPPTLYIPVGGKMTVCCLQKGDHPP